MAKSWNILSFWRKTIEKDGEETVLLSGNKLTFGELKQKLIEAGENVGLDDFDNLSITIFPNSYKEKETHPDYKLIIKKDTYKKD